MGYQIIRSFEPPYPAPMAALVEGAIADLAGRLGVAAESIAVEGLHAVVWSDGSIGCPQPGMLYTQALVEGALIVLGAGGARYRYHSAEGRPAFLCERPG